MTTTAFAQAARIATVLVVVGLAAGCGKKEGSEPAETAGSTEQPASQVEITSPVGFVWKWEGTQTPVERIIPPNPADYTLEFLPDTTVTAQIDCNRGHGKYRLEGKSILIGPLATTRMACPPGSLDGKFLQHLEAARSIFFRGDSLFMDLFADSGTMKFSQMPEPQGN
jgi:heat shock protein HslJ